MLLANRLARTLFLLITTLALAGCFGSADTTPEEDIPDIPPATRTMPGESGGETDTSGGATPAQPPR